MACLFTTALEKLLGNECEMGRLPNSKKIWPSSFQQCRHFQIEEKSRAQPSRGCKHARFKIFVFRLLLYTRLKVELFPFFFPLKNIIQRRRAFHRFLLSRAQQRLFIYRRKKKKKELERTSRDVRNIKTNAAKERTPLQKKQNDDKDDNSGWKY